MFEENEQRKNLFVESLNWNTRKTKRSDEFHFAKGRGVRAQTRPGRERQDHPAQRPHRGRRDHGFQAAIPAQVGTQAIPLTVTPVTVKYYSYSDSFFVPKRIVL